MNTIGSRIKEYRLRKGMTQQEIADALHESSGRVIYNWEKGIGRPDCDKLARLCDLLDISADELLGCKLITQRPTVTEWDMLRKYRMLDEHGKTVVEYLIDTEYKRISTITCKHKVNMLRLDYYTIPVSAGTGNFLNEEYAEKIYVPETLTADAADFIVSISGDSMEPTYCDKDMVFVGKCDAINMGEVGIFILNGEVYIKELGNNKLISHNEKYKPILFSDNDSIYCCGKVLGIVNNMM